MSFDIAGGLRNLKGGALDALRGPYASLTAANLAIPNVVVDSVNFREGKQVDIIVSAGVYRTYWWQGGYADENLVEMLIKGDKGDKGDAFTYDDFTPEEIEDLKQPAIDAAVIATEAANNAVIATDNAIEATADAITATNNAVEATQEATEAANLANTAADNTVQAISDTVAATDAANEATTNANEATENTNEAIEAANIATNNTIEAINDAIEATTNANTATGNANTAADAANAATAAIGAAQGWETVRAIESDGLDREVEKIVDYIGGTGVKPTANIGKYIGATGLVDTKAEAVSVKGSQGIPGITTTNMAEFSLLGRDVAGAGTPKSLTPHGLMLGNNQVITAGGDITPVTPSLRIINITNPKGGFLKHNADQVGAIKIELPSNATVMYTIKGFVFNYNNQNSIDFCITCYGSAMNNGYSAVILSQSSSSKIPVRFFTDGVKPYVAIGEVDTTWRLPNIVIYDVGLSHSGVNNTFVENFALKLSYITGFTGTQSAILTECRPQFNPSQVISEYSVGADTPFTNTDTLTQMLAKAQGQINNRLTPTTGSQTFASSSVYYMTSGYLIATSINSEVGDRLIFFEIQGHGNITSKPFTILLNCRNQGASVLEAYNAISIGLSNVQIKLFALNGLIHIWLPFSGDFWMLNVFCSQITQSSNTVSRATNTVTGITNSAMPTVGVTREVTVTPVAAILNDGSSSNLIKGDGTTQPLSTLPAFTATKLLTPRNINGVAFDGTGNITVADSTKVAKSGDTMAGDLLLSSATPPNNLSASPKQYVDNSVANAIAGLQFKVDVLAASTANVNIASAPSTLDGVTLASTNRILLKDQTNATENGIYVFNGAGNALTRSLDADSGVELANKTIPVNQGTENADAWYKIINDTITLGTTNIIFSKVGGDGNYTAGSQISIAGNTISVAQDSTHRFVTDEEKSYWDAKSTVIKGTTSASNTDMFTTRYKDVTVTGAATTDIVVVNNNTFKNGTAGLILVSGQVISTDTVRLYFSTVTVINAGDSDASLDVQSVVSNIANPQTINFAVIK